MFTWIPYAFLRIVVFFIAGILLGIYFPDSVPVLYTTILFIVCIITYFLMVWYYYRRDGAVNPGFAGLVAIFVAGYLNAHVHHQTLRSDHIAGIDNNITEYVAVVAGAPQHKTKTWKVPVELRQVRTNKQWRVASGMVLLYLSHEQFAQPPAYGDVLLIEGQPQLVAAPANPGEFDYKRFLSYQGIYHQQFIRNQHVKCISHEPPNVLIEKAILARHWAEHILTQFVTGTREQGIAIALVLGVTDGLDRELVGAYGTTGTLHVLAVSGLHISIIYMIIAWLLTPLNRTTKGKWLVAMISLVVLWSYAFITGLSPSVLRAVTMFTFVALAKPWKQTLNIYNTLAASAFLLLLFDPFMIMSVGFQLSYLAVLGIVYLHPRLYAMFEPSNQVVDEIWKVTSVSVAAQVGTLPVALLMFHQFPNYFMVSNLLVIPISFMVLIAGILVLAFSWIQLIAQGIGWILTWSIKIMNMIVFAIDATPGSLTDHIFITPFQAFLLAMLIVFALLLIERKHFSYVVAICIVVCILSASRWFFYMNEVRQAYIAVYQVNHHIAVDLVENGFAITLQDSVLASDDQKKDFHVNPGRLMHGVNHVRSQLDVIRHVDGGRIFYWRDKCFLWIDHQPKSAYPSISVDYVLVSNDAIRSLALLGNVKRSHTIVDSSNSFYLAKQLLVEASEKDHPLFAVPVQGSYYEKISL